MIKQSAELVMLSFQINKLPLGKYVTLLILPATTAISEDHRTGLPK